MSRALQVKIPPAQQNNYSDPPIPEVIKKVSFNASIFSFLLQSVYEQMKPPTPHNFYSLPADPSGSTALIRVTGAFSLPHSTYRCLPRSTHI